MKIKENELNELLEAHLQKADKVNIYAPRVKANMVNGVPVFKATWSWWAFLGGWAFFLYRKIYLVAVAFLLASIVGGVFPLLMVLTFIIAGVSGFYFYTKKFSADLEIAGYGKKPLNEVKEKLKELGGYNSWVIWVVSILNILLLIGIFYLATITSFL